MSETFRRLRTAFNNKLTEEAGPSAQVYGPVFTSLLTAVAEEIDLLRHEIATNRGPEDPFNENAYNHRYADDTFSDAAQVVTDDNTLAQNVALVTDNVLKFLSENEKGNVQTIAKPGFYNQYVTVDGVEAARILVAPTPADGRLTVGVVWLGEYEKYKR